MAGFRHLLLNTSLALALFYTGPALAQSGADAARLNRLETEIETLSRAVFRGEMPPGGTRPASEPAMAANMAANMEVRLSQMEETVRSLTGQIEQQNFQLRQTQERLDRVLSELDRRMLDVENRARQNTGAATGAPMGTYPDASYSDTPAAPSWVDGMAPLTTTAPVNNAPVINNVPPQTAPLGTLSAQDTAPPQAAAALPPAALPLTTDSPAAFYEQSFALLRERQYEASGQAFNDFLTRWPDHELAENARYWLGESWYVRNNFERAARLFAEAYQKAPKGGKAPDNLLKLALSLNGMGKKEEACLTLAQLGKEFGSNAGPVSARGQQEAQRMGCGG